MYSIATIELPFGGNLKRMTGDSGRIVFSRILQWQNKNVFTDISIKYVLKGTEYYYDSKQNQYKVNTGEFLLGGFEQNTGNSFVNSSTIVDGICFYVKKEMLEEVYATLINRKLVIPDILSVRHLEFPDFFNNVFNARHTPLNLTLKKCGQYFYTKNAEVPENLFTELLYETAEKIVLLQSEIREQIVNLNNLKPNTRNEILKRLLRAKNYMDDNYIIGPSLAEISSAAGLSKYHFLRCFRQAYTQTPFEYVHNRRLEYARSIIQKGETELKGVAKLCSFSDMASFSKAFKRKFGISPSAIQKEPRKKIFFY